MISGEISYCHLKISTKNVLFIVLLPFVSVIWNNFVLPASPNLENWHKVHASCRPASVHLCCNLKKRLLIITESNGCRRVRTAVAKMSIKLMNKYTRQTHTMHICSPEIWAFVSTWDHPRAILETSKYAIWNQSFWINSIFSKRSVVPLPPE